MLVAHLLADCGRFAEAIAPAEEGVSLYDSFMGPNHSETVRMSESLAEIRRKAADSSHPAISASQRTLPIDAASR